MKILLYMALFCNALATILCGCSAYVFYVENNISECKIKLILAILNLILFAVNLVRWRIDDDFH